MEHKLAHLDITAEEFYNNTDSIYIRLTHLPSEHGFKVAMFNQIDVKAVNDELIFMATLARGLCEAVLTYPSDMFELGKAAQDKDIEEIKEHMTPEQRELMDIETKGNA